MREFQKEGALKRRDEVDGWGSKAEADEVQEKSHHRSSEQTPVNTVNKYLTANYTRIH